MCPLDRFCEREHGFQTLKCVLSYIAEFVVYQTEDSVPLNPMRFPLSIIQLFRVLPATNVSRIVAAKSKVAAAYGRAATLHFYPLTSLSLLLYRLLQKENSLSTPSLPHPRPRPCRLMQPPPPSLPLYYKPRLAAWGFV